MLDFTKLLQIFEAKGITFVSVTQHFNTNSSMGRLTLNILLSFAQFEREIISERTRDKLSAAKKKGKFVGGRPGLGYDLDRANHKLIVNPKEAALVREIFYLYLEQKSILNVVKLLNERGQRTKEFTLSGKPAGGTKFSVGTVNYILRRTVYIGKILSNGEMYSAEHEAIIDEATFNKVQILLKENRLNNNSIRSKNIGLLSRMLFCKSCQKTIFYSYVQKKNYNYSCYVCVGSQKRGYASCPTGCLNAQRTEDAVLANLRNVISDKRIEPCAWSMFTLNEKREILQSLVKRAEYDSVNHLLNLQMVKDEIVYDFPINLKIALKTKKETIEDKLKKEPRIRQVLLLAHQIQNLLNERKAKNLKEIAHWLNVTLPRVHQYSNLLRLVPAIQEEIILSKTKILSSIPEHMLRRIYAEINSQEQILLWQELKDSKNIIS